MGGIIKTPFIIADVGSNWKRYTNDDANLNLALRHIDDAAMCGVDAVKFQFFTHKDLYGVPGDDSYALPLAFVPRLASHAAIRRVEFMCTTFSPEALRFINPFVQTHKIASSEFCYWDLINDARLTEKPIIYSTGGASDLEIERAIKERITTNDVLLECVAAYPAEAKEYDLHKMREWGKGDFRVGVSDHTLGYLLAITAIGFGASVFEKHFDTLKAWEKITPDTAVSANPQELKEYCRTIREAYKISRAKKNKAHGLEEGMRLKWKRRLKATMPLKSGLDVLENGVNFGLYRSLEDDTKAASAQELHLFQGRRLKRGLVPQQGLWFDDIE